MPRARIFAILLATASCASIPDLAFEPDDGGADGGAHTGDASAPLSHDDAGAPDPGTDASAPDGAPTDDASVPPGVDAEPPPPPDAAPPPPDSSTGCALLPGASQCCGSVSCVGNKCAGNCDLCAPCTGYLVCCVAPNGKTATCGANVVSCGHGAGNGGD